MSDLLQAAWLGVIEGLTEFLPISSTGHLLIAEHWLGERSELFNVAIQSGAILAAVLVFWPRIKTLLFGLNEPTNRDYLFKLTLAFVITAVGGLIAKELGVGLPTTIAPVAGALIVGGVIMLLVEWFLKDRAAVAEATWSVAFWVGLCQILAAVFPGTSRSAATIFAAMLAGMTSRPWWPLLPCAGCCAIYRPIVLRCSPGTESSPESSCSPSCTDRPASLFRYQSAHPGAAAFPGSLKANSFATGQLAVSLNH
jgi:Bacitracin resistance protein BacA